MGTGMMSTLRCPIRPLCRLWSVSADHSSSHEPLHECPHPKPLYSRPLLVKARAAAAGVVQGGRLVAVPGGANSIVGLPTAGGEVRR
jgi:hypothetical protein